MKVTDINRAAMKKYTWLASGVKPWRKDSKAIPNMAIGSAKNVTVAGRSRNIAQLTTGTSTTDKLVIKAPSPRLLV